MKTRSPNEGRIHLDDQCPHQAAPSSQKTIIQPRNEQRIHVSAHPGVTDPLFSLNSLNEPIQPSAIEYASFYQHSIVMQVSLLPKVKITKSLSIRSFPSAHS